MARPAHWPPAPRPGRAQPARPACDFAPLHRAADGRRRAGPRIGTPPIRGLDKLVAQAVPERTRRDQTVEDCIVSSGPAIALISLMGSLQDGRYVLSVWNTPPFALIAAPVALYLWHKTAQPPLPPPAGTAVFITLIVTNRQ